MALLRNAIVGAWQLKSFQAVDAASGESRQPLGPRPRGLIVYTADGWMSAQLAPDDSDPELSEYIAYCGPFDIDEQTAIVHHAVSMATMPDLLLAPQYRQVQISGDTLTLSASSNDQNGATIDSTLVWHRPSSHNERDRHA